MIARLGSLWPPYLTAFVIACAITVGVIIGVNVTYDMALDGIAKLTAFTKAEILRKHGQ